MSDAIFRPRPYEEIYAEQAYLATSLQVQSSKANELLRQYSLLEEELENMTASKQRRRLRKRLNLVRSQLTGAAEQEKAIFIRLSEVYMEVHSRDAWAQASRPRVVYRGVLGQAQNHAAIRGSSSCSNTRPSTYLSGASPEFVPRNRRAVQRPAGAQAVSEAGQARPPTSSPSVTSARASESGDAGLDVSDGDSGKCPRDRGLGFQYKAAAGRAKSGDGRGNRLSLPNLESIWPN
ncbi:hypothetical protein HRG_008145 [Hirsutella rhossiliensis]|uniref:Uncharacterized protein n=1 Tax=Hirsutella rhossiliensis TaxID=111463 RepID=A0A9P8MT79_9HYPO|nr:uncharacterized protein HRG_08145 [Hirsutella rhossiliensis]KAH0960992.1 hypothetical protein HRG_08145 [Hirsutella rhossiliensis]